MALAQYSDTVFQSDSGRAYSGVKIEALDGGSPVPLYRDAAGTPASQITSNANGLFTFWVGEGTYTLRYSLGGVTLGSQANVEIYNLVKAVDLSDEEGAETVGVATGDTLQEFLDTLDQTSTQKANAEALGVTGSDTNLGSFAGSTIPAGSTAKTALQALETVLEATATEAAAKATAAAIGVAATAPNMGTTPGTILSDNGTAQAWFQEVEAAFDAPVATPKLTLPYTNPALNGGLFGLNDGISKTNTVEAHTLSGTRDKAWIGKTITVDDGCTAPASGPATASYGLSVYMQRPNWNTSSITGEMDGLNITLRQANGDSAGILSNILTRNGFGATIESYTGSADNTGATLKAVNVQIGVVNSRDGGEYGFVAQSVVGTGLSAGFRAVSTSGTSWDNYYEAVNAAGQHVFFVDGPTEATFTKSVVPITQYGGNLGAPSLEYDVAYMRALKLVPRNFSSLPAASGNAGMVARITDAAAAITTFNQIVSAGGGSNTALVTSDGTNWRALSS